MVLKPLPLWQTFLVPLPEFPHSLPCQTVSQGVCERQRGRECCRTRKCPEKNKRKTWWTGLCIMYIVKMEKRKAGNKLLGSRRRGFMMNRVSGVWGLLRIRVWGIAFCLWGQCLFKCSTPLKLNPMHHGLQKIGDLESQRESEELENRCDRGMGR